MRKLCEEAKADYGHLCQAQHDLKELNIVHHYSKYVRGRFVRI